MTAAKAELLAERLNDAATAGMRRELVEAFAAQGYVSTRILEVLLANPDLIDELNTADATIQRIYTDRAQRLFELLHGAPLVSTGVYPYGGAWVRWQMYGDRGNR